MTKFQRQIGIVLGMSLGFSLALGEATPAQSQGSVLMTDPLSVELNTNLLAPEANLPADGSILRRDTISQAHITEPSLWWAQEQFSYGKLIDNWLAYSGSDGNLRRVDLVVTQQIWSIFNYFERYGFVTRIGTIAWDYGFNTRIFNRDRELLAAYICQPGTPTAADSTTEQLLPPCEVTFYICESLETVISAPQNDAPQPIDYCREDSESGGAPSADPNPLGGR